MNGHLLGRAEELRGRRTPFVLATVVRAERPTSAHPGDRAIVLADGTVEGFVGGACAAARLRAESAALIAAAGGSTVLRIGPGPENPCVSGGSLEIFLEAVMPAALVQVFGDTPIARALVAVGEAAGYEVRAGSDPAAPIRPDAAAVVVASHGHDEPPVLRAALAAGVPYLALVASRKRGAAVLADLEHAERVKTPAGLDLGARTPGEVAVSILAELISRHPAAPAPAPQESAVDPVCGMTVVVSPATISHQHAGQDWYFCASGCRDAFVRDHPA